MNAHLRISDKLLLNFYFLFETPTTTKLQIKIRANISTLANNINIARLSKVMQTKNITFFFSTYDAFNLSKLSLSKKKNLSKLSATFWLVNDIIRILILQT
jgi:hypothetical protein